MSDNDFIIIDEEKVKEETERKVVSGEESGVTGREDDVSGGSVSGDSDKQEVA